MKRTNYIDWHTAFMGVATIMSYRSKDPSTQHGAVIINENNRIIATGYNGFPKWCHDNKFPWTKPDKYDYVIHAEENAILNSTQSLEGCTMYLFSEKGYMPCANCAKAIVQKGLENLVIVHASHRDTTNIQPTYKMFHAASVNIIILNNPVKIYDDLISKLQKTRRELKKYLKKGKPCS